MLDAQGQYWNRMVPELTVTDFAASLHFYVDILGFSIMIRRDQPDFAYLNMGEAQLMLEQHHAQGWNTAELLPPLGRGVNLQIEVDDIEVILNRLQHNHIALYREIRDSYYDVGDKASGQREFLVQDPDGYLLRFSQYIEP